MCGCVGVGVFVWCVSVCVSVSVSVSVSVCVSLCVRVCVVCAYRLSLVSFWSLSTVHAWLACFSFHSSLSLRAIFAWHASITLHTIDRQLVDSKHVHVCFCIVHCTLSPLAPGCPSLPSSPSAPYKRSER